MVQSLLKSLFLYGVFAASAVLAAPAHQHESAPLARGISPRQYLQSPHPPAAGLTVTTPETIGKRSPKVGGRVKKVTNAMRMANGLPPLPPRKLYEGSQTGSAHKARASPLPPVSVPAILVYGPNGRSGAPLGFVSRDLTSGIYSFTTDCNKALKNGNLYAGDLTNPAQTTYPYVGLTPGYPVNTWPSIGYISGTAQFPDGPALTPNKLHAFQSTSDWYAESKVWSLGANNELLLTWINPNGAAIPLKMAYVTKYSNQLSAVVDVAAARTAFNYDAATMPAIRMFIANQFTCGGIIS